MDFVTLTDHDTIQGVLRIADRGDVLIGEELSCWFPEDHCKMHVLVYGISPADHDALQSRAKNIYEVAEYIEHKRIAHSVAHPIYRQNDRLERWHLERLLLMFKGFECLNGAHSPLHREAFEPVLDRLTPREIARLSEIHNISPRWHEPWIKARTAGSDDHGLLNVGRTWTEFPPEAVSPSDILDCLRDGRCAPAGEAGSTAKLAHTFYSVAVRYYSRHIMTPTTKPNFATSLLQTIVGERPAPTKAQLAGASVRSKLKRLRRGLSRPFSDRESRASEGTGIVKRLFLKSARSRIGNHHALFEALSKGLPPLGEHEEMFEFVKGIDRDVLQGIANAIDDSIDRASFTGLFDSISAILAQQFVLLPYYFAVFHQNKERHLLRQITGRRTLRDAQSLRVGLFTDTFDEINGVGRFLRDVSRQAAESGRNLLIHTCCTSPAGEHDARHRRNFLPLLSRQMPYYPELKLSLPPVMEILEWADRQQFDAIHVSTPGPMGLCGWLVARMLRVPMLATYHTDFPAYVERLSGDHRITNGTIKYMSWFYNQAATVFLRSPAYRFKLLDLGVPESRLALIQPAIDLKKFNPRHRDVNVWPSLGVTRAKRLLYAGRVSVEKNLPLLVDIFKTLCAMRDDVELIVAGDGPYTAPMHKALQGMPVSFVGHQDDEQLARLYASSDIFVFPSRTDTLGQVVMEAQACGLPAIVSAEGGPREMVLDDVSGMVMSSNDPAAWATAIDALLSDEPRRLRMGLMAANHAGRNDLPASFQRFWDDHLSAVEPDGNVSTDPSRPHQSPAMPRVTIATPGASKDHIGL
jgi:glycosyltransferase involved in cell wall biosynthesis